MGNCGYLTLGALVRIQNRRQNRRDNDKYIIQLAVYHVYVLLSTNKPTKKQPPKGDCVLIMICARELLNVIYILIYSYAHKNINNGLQRFCVYPSCRATTGI